MSRGAAEDSFSATRLMPEAYATPGFRDCCRTRTPKGCTELSRWLASEASVTTGSSVLPLPAPRLGCQDSVLELPVVTLVSLANHRLSSVHPFGVPLGNSPLQPWLRSAAAPRLGRSGIAAERRAEV